MAAPKREVMEQEVEAMTSKTKKAAPGVVGRKMNPMSLVADMMGGGAIGKALMFAAKNDLVCVISFRKKEADE